MSAPLAVRSAGSLLRGRVDSAALAEQAAALGYGALGLADRDGLYAAVRFAGACATHGVRPVLGVELPAGPVGKAAAAARFDGPPVVRVFARVLPVAGRALRLLVELLQALGKQILQAVHAGRGASRRALLAA